MLRFGGLLNSLLLSTEDFSIITGKNFTWDKRKMMLQVNRKGLLRGGVAGAILGLLQLANLLSVLSKRTPGTNTISPEITLGIYFSGSYLSWQSYFCFSILFFKSEFEGFINSAYRFELTHAKELRELMGIKSNRRLLAVTKVYTFTTRQAGTKLATFVVALVSVVMPSLPMNFFSFPPGQNLMDLLHFLGLHKNTVLGHFSMAFTFAVNWYASILIIKFGVIGMNRAMIGAASLAVYISIIKRTLAGGSIFHTSTKHEQRILNASKAYKEMQILVTSFNRVHSGILVSILVNTMIFLVLGAVNVIKATAAGKFMDYDSIILNLYFVQAVCMSTVLIIAVFGVCGNLHYESCRELTRMKMAALNSGRKRRLMEKTMKGLPVLKIEFGATNFVEKKTPFVYIEFALARIVDNLLLSKH
ncbi:unnamed protein product [Orchesella dallaii]|uniref:Odorant receptor n=1 Tax=Orchesella dallaii TaxID=48710 RepID=A0ABP1RV70_9HEXA